tara:strand:+ start:7976 stop:8632 length:657 start_codon:yes stop_codon:yes gene_type:complete
MKKKTAIAILFLIVLTTYNPRNKISITKFNLKEIKIENNFLLEEKDLKRSLISLYDKNLIFLKNSEIKEILMNNSFIDSYNLKKKYPDTLKIKIFEKKPIAIILNKKKKFYLSDKIELIDFKNLPYYENLPYIYGNVNNFKVFYKDLKKINFPFDQVKKYILLETNRWDLETLDGKTVKLPVENYILSLKNFLIIKKEDNFKNYKVFDYRIVNQLILK